MVGAGTGFMGLLACLQTIVFREFIPLQILEIIERFRVTLAFLVPAMILALLSEKAIECSDLSSLRRIIYGASPIPLGLLRRALRGFRRTDSISVYGLTSITGLVPARCPPD